MTSAIELIQRILDQQENARQALLREQIDHAIVYQDRAIDRAEHARAVLHQRPPATLSLDSLDECLAELEELRNRSEYNADAEDGTDMWCLHLGVHTGLRMAISRLQAARDALAAQMAPESRQDAPEEA